MRIEMKEKKDLQVNRFINNKNISLESSSRTN